MRGIKSGWTINVANQLTIAVASWLVAMIVSIAMVINQPIG